MNNLPFLKRYSGEKLEVLLNMDGLYRTDSLILALERAVDRKRTQKGAASLSNPEMTLLSVCALEREVNNGGYNQFFGNPSSAFSSRIVQDLKSIGCAAVAQITKTAIDALELESLAAEVVQGRITQDDEVLLAKHEACDAEYYRTDDQIEMRLFQFVKVNRQSFKIPIAVRIGSWLESKLRRS